jgi:putative ABC transport system ATP-binding protein
MISTEGERHQEGIEVRVRGLSHWYRSPDGELRVLTDVDLDVPAGGYCVLQGPSGVGKTTLLAILGGLRRPARGTVRVGDTDLGRLRGDELAAYRRSTVGFVFQHFGLLDTLSALENVELAMSLTRAGRSERRARARKLLAAVGLADRARHRPPQLSGGERQRLAMARALANRPRLLLADEPTGNLDDSTSERVVGLLERLHRDRSFTLIVVTHDRSITRRAPQHLVLRSGRLVAA